MAAQALLVDERSMYEVQPTEYHRGPPIWRALDPCSASPPLLLSPSPSPSPQVEAIYDGLQLGSPVLKKMVDARRADAAAVLGASDDATGATAARASTSAASSKSAGGVPLIKAPGELAGVADRKMAAAPIRNGRRRLPLFMRSHSPSSAACMPSSKPRATPALGSAVALAQPQVDLPSLTALVEDDT